LCFTLRLPYFFDISDANANDNGLSWDPYTGWDIPADADAEAEDDSFDISHVNANACDVGGEERAESEEEEQSVEAFLARLPDPWEGLAIDSATVILSNPPLSLMHPTNNQ
jgi:hypothetical protein